MIKGGADARYLPAGYIIYALGGALFSVPFDAQRREVVGGPVPIVEGVRRSSVTAAAQFAVSLDGSLMYIPALTASGQQLDLALLDRKGTIERLKLSPRAYEFPRVSPDGRNLAVGIDEGKEANVWIYDLAGTSPIRRLTFGGNNRFPIWTSDSTRVAFQSDREGDPAIFWQRADGTGTAEQITRPDKGQIHIPHAWSPKGDSVLFSVGTGSDQSLWTFSLQDKKAAPFGAVRYSSSVPPNATFSPDGRWVAYASVETGRSTVFVQPFPATGAKYQIADSRNPFWAPDGKELFFAAEGTGVFSVVGVKTELTFTFGNPTSFPWPGHGGRGDFRNYDIAPDGNRFVIVVDASDTATDAGSAPRIQVVLNWTEELKRLVPTK